MNHAIQKQQPDVPLIIFFTLFVIIAIGLFSKLMAPNNKSVPAAPMQVEVKSPVKKDEKQLDIMKPLKCEFVNKESSYSAQMKGDAISLSVVEKEKIMKVVVAADCVYRWEEQTKIGTKRCGIGTALKVGKQLISSGLVKMDTILPYIQKMGGASSPIQDPIRSCLNTNAVDDRQFIVPKNVQFTAVKEIK
jgi:hypothetical protein